MEREQHDASSPEPSRPSGRRPLVVALIGLPGAGKSTVARALEQQLGLRRVCRDAIRHALFPHCEYSFLEKRAAFRSVLLAIEINGLIGASSVVDGMTFSRRGDYDQIAALAGAHALDLLGLWIDCPPALARERIGGDGAHPAADRVPGLVDVVAARFEPVPRHAVRIDAAASQQQVCERAVAVVAARLGAAS